MQKDKLRELLAGMSLKEKIGQMSQLMMAFFENPDASGTEGVATGPAAQLGLTSEDIDLLGSILSSSGAQELMDFQKKYMEKHPHHIPILFMLM